MSQQLNPDTQATLLLCGRLGQAPTSGTKPLSLREYNQLARWLQSTGMRPAALLHPEGRARLSDLPEHVLASQRVTTLLRRGAALALTIEGWTNKGGWIIGRSEETYPRRWRERLKQDAPPLLYGIGNPALLASGGLVIVGSRNADPAALAATRQVARACAHQQLPIISGGARGVDSEAVLAALEADGQGVAILADSLARIGMSSTYRPHLMAEKLVLVSPYDPDAGFSVGHAMERNKYIYALGDWALVVSSSHGQGGTWAGAVEQLGQEHIPLFVHTGRQVPRGNQALIEQGGIACDIDLLTQAPDLRSWFAKQSAGTTALEAQTEPMQLTHQTGAEQSFRTITEDTTRPSADNQERSLFSVVWPYIETELHTARTAKELTRLFLDVRLEQMRAWLRLAEKKGKVRQVDDERYIAVTQAREQPAYEGQSPAGQQAPLFYMLEQGGEAPSKETR